VLDVIEYPEPVHHLEARLQAGKEPARAPPTSIVPKRNTFDHGWIWPVDSTDDLGP